jgi:hypothetical protein
MTHFKYQVCLGCYKTSICEKTFLSVNFLLKFPKYFRVFSKGMGDFIHGPGILYLCRSRNTFLSWRKKESRMGYVQNFPLSANGCFAGSGMKDSKGILEFD